MVNVPKFCTLKFSAKIAQADLDQTAPEVCHCIKHFMKQLHIKQNLSQKSTVKPV